jgi:AcrR family transcriptional regulator
MTAARRLPESTRTDPRWERTRHALIDAGRRVLARNGAAAATVMEIVREARVSQPSFYNHFASLDALIEAIAADFFEADIAHKVGVFSRAADPAEAIAMNAVHTLRMARTDPAVAWVMVRQGSLQEVGHKRAGDNLVRMINAGLRKGRFRVGDAGVAAAAIRGAACPLLQDMLLDRAPPDVERQFAALLLQMLGLSHREANAVADKVAQSAAAPEPQPVNEFSRRRKS